MSQLEFLTYHAGRATYRVVGGPRQFFATFYRSDDLTDEQLETREEFARDVLAVKPLRRRPAVNHARARAALEAAGARALAEDDRPEPAANRKWLVRIYYRSEGGEVLCFDAGPFARSVADRVASEHAARQDFVENTLGKPRKLAEMYRDRAGDPPSAEVFDRDEVGADAAAQGRTRQPAVGRLVVLPSQRREKPEQIPELAE